MGPTAPSAGDQIRISPDWSSEATRSPVGENVTSYDLVTELRPGSALGGWRPGSAGRPSDHGHRRARVPRGVHVQANSPGGTVPNAFGSPSGSLSAWRTPLLAGCLRPGDQQRHRQHPGPDRRPPEPHGADLAQVRQRPEPHALARPSGDEKVAIGTEREHARSRVGLARQGSGRSAVPREKSRIRRLLPLFEASQRPSGLSSMVVDTARVLREVKLLRDPVHGQDAGHGPAPQDLERERPRLARVGEVEAPLRVGEGGRGIGVEVVRPRARSFAGLGAEGLGLRLVPGPRRLVARDADGDRHRRRGHDAAGRDGGARPGACVGAPRSRHRLREVLLERGQRARVAAPPQLVLLERRPRPQEVARAAPSPPTGAPPA